MPSFIYALADPREAERIKYVGMSMRTDRPWDHVKATRKSKRKSHLYSWIKLLLSEGYEPAVSLIEQCVEGISRKELGEREKYYIKRLREEGHDLTNMTEGGDGSTGFKGRCHTVETRAKMRKAWESRTQHAQTLATRIKIGNANRGLRRSPEIIVRYSECHKGQVPWNKGKQLVPDDSSPSTRYRRTGETTGLLTRAERIVKRLQRAEAKLAKLKVRLVAQEQE